MIWKPKQAEQRFDPVCVFRVTEDLYMYLKRVALKQMLKDDPDWQPHFGVLPTWEPDEVYIGHQRVVRDDWLILGVERITVVSPMIFNKLYRLVD